MKRMPLSRETSGGVRPCKAKDEPGGGDSQNAIHRAHQARNDPAADGKLCAPRLPTCIFLP